MMTPPTSLWLWPRPTCLSIGRGFYIMLAAAPRRHSRAVAFHVERDEPPAEQLTQASADLAALGLAALQSGEQEPVLRQRPSILEQTGADQLAAHWDGAGT